MSTRILWVWASLAACAPVDPAAEPDLGASPEAEAEAADARLEVPADAGLGANDPRCAAEAAYLAEQGGVLEPVCGACHTAGGPGAGSRLQLPEGPAFEGFRLAHARLAHDAEGRSPLLLKPGGALPHGGGVAAPPGGPVHVALSHLVANLEDPAAVAGCTAEVPGVQVTRMDPAATLHKALRHLAGRPPTDEELHEITRDFDQLDPILRAAMAEPAFSERLRELFNDVLLTDAERMEQSYGGLAGRAIPDDVRALEACDAVHWESYDERTGTEIARTCMAAQEALAREPLHLIAHVVAEGRPFSEILTAQYRYLNAPAARLLGLDLTPFAGHEADPAFFAEVRVPALHGPGGRPEEYAGVLTTTAFLARHPSGATNRNRKRAHVFYKSFVGLDVMQGALRLDLSQVDPAGDPWRHDPQCIGCHATLDPVAGAFQHWTNCYGVPEVRYFPERYCGGDWFPADQMFPPGTGPHPDEVLAPDEVPTALAHLARATVERPAFARTVAAHLLAGLTGQPRLHPALEGPARAAYAAQEATLDHLAARFTESGLDLPTLIVEVVRSDAFRAVAGEGDPAALEGLGGGALVPPEVQHRMVEALMGQPWAEAGALRPGATPSLRDPPFPLLSLHRMRLLAGGIDSMGLTERPRVPSPLALAALTRMAHDVACRATAWDFALQPGDRHLFARVEPDTAWDDPATTDQIRWLHRRFLGEAVDEAELEHSRNLLISLSEAALAEGPALPEACAARIHHATGGPAPRVIDSDPTGHLRAWQGFLVYLLTDPHFWFEG